MAGITSDTSRNILPSLVGRPREADSPFRHDRGGVGVGDAVAGAGHGILRAGLRLGAQLAREKDNDLTLAVSEYAQYCGNFIAERDAGVNGADWLKNSEQDWSLHQNKFREGLRTRYPNMDLQEFDRRAYRIDDGYSSKVRQGIANALKRQTDAAANAAIGTAESLYHEDGNIDALIDCVDDGVGTKLGLSAESLNGLAKDIDAIAGDIDWENQEEVDAAAERLECMSRVTIGGKEYEVVGDNYSREHNGIASTISRTELRSQLYARQKDFINMKALREHEVASLVTGAVTERVARQCASGDFDGARATMMNAVAAAEAHGIVLNGRKLDELSSMIRTDEAVCSGAQNAQVALASAERDDRGYVGDAELSALYASAKGIAVELESTTDKTARAMLESQRNTMLAGIKGIEAENAALDAENLGRCWERWRELCDGGMAPAAAAERVLAAEDASRPYYAEFCKRVQQVNAVREMVVREQETQERRAALQEAKDARATRDEWLNVSLAAVPALQLQLERNNRKAEQERTDALKAAGAVVEKGLKEKLEALDNARATFNGNLAREILGKNSDFIAGAVGGSDYNLYILRGKVAEALRAGGDDGLPVICAYLKAKGEDPYGYSGDEKDRRHVMELLRADGEAYAAGAHPAPGIAEAKGAAALSERLDMMTAAYARGKADNDRQYSAAVGEARKNSETELDAKRQEIDKRFRNEAVFSLDNAAAVRRGKELAARVNGMGGKTLTPDQRQILGEASEWFESERRLAEENIVNALCEARQQKQGQVVLAGGKRVDVRDEAGVRQVLSLFGIEGEAANNAVSRIKSRGNDVWLAEKAIANLFGRYDAGRASSFSPEHFAAASPWLVKAVTERIGRGRMSKMGERDLLDDAEAFIVSQTGMRNAGGKANRLKEGDSPRPVYSYSLETLEDSGAGIFSTDVRQGKRYGNYFEGVLGALENARKCGVDFGDPAFSARVMIGFSVTEAGQALLENQHVLEEFIRMSKDAEAENLDRVMR